VTTVPTLPVTQLDTYETADGLKQRGSTITYDIYGDVTGKTDYDYGTSSTRGPVLRSETISGYGTVGPVANYTSDAIKDGSGNLISDTILSYDTTALVTTSGVPQHVSVSSERGNLNRVTSLISNSNYAAGNAYYFYDDTGQVLSSYDANNNITKYAYDSSYNAYLVGITWPAVNGVTQSEQITPDFNTGLPMNVTLDGNKTSYVYDSMLREKTSTAPDNGVKTWTYDLSGSVSGGAPATESVSVIHAGSTSMTVTGTLDWYGRLQTTNTTDDIANDLVTYSYDANGNAASATNPYKTGASQNVSYATYDVLGRQLTLKEPDCQGTTCSVQTSVLQGNTNIVTDEAGHKRELFSDGLGRIAEVLESDTSGNLTLETDYLYIQNYSNSTGAAPSTYQMIVNQKGGSTNSSLWRTRTFTYDLAGRVVSVKTPEAGLISYTYNQGASLCTGNPSQPCSQTDARGVVTTYTYDALNRLTGKSYTTAGTASAPTPSVNYTYDQTSFNGLTITNGQGNLTGMTDGTGSTAWSYDQVGRPVATRKTLNGVTLQSNVTYNLDGTVNTLQDFGGTTLTYTYTGAGLQKGVTDQTGRSYASAGTYNAAGQLTGLTLPLTSGSLQQTLGYNSRMQPETIQATVGGSLVQNLTIGYGTVGQNNGNISTITNGMDPTHGRDQAYQYDYLNRVTQGGDNTHWGEQYGYDNWGNLNQKTQTLGSGYGFSVLSPANNQMPQMSYDAAGDVTRDQLGTAITYDANGRIVTAGSGTYSYDGSDYRVTKTSGGVTTLYWPSPVAGVVDESNATGTSFGRQVFLGGFQVWSEDTAGNGRYLLQDHLASTRVTVNMAGTVLDDLDYRSYGDIVANYGANPSDNHYVFTGYESDSTDSSTDYAQYRNLSSYMGRFTRPDPYYGSYDFTNPQSFNRYSYVLNGPLNYIDPSGLDADKCNMQATSLWTWLTQLFGCGGGGGGDDGGGWDDGGGGGSGQHNAPHPYVAPIGPGTEIGSILDLTHPSNPGPITSPTDPDGQCVTACRHYEQGLPDHTQWTQGVPVVISVNGKLTINPAVKPGTAIATFVDGRYPGDEDLHKNSGVFLGTGNWGPAGSMQILDQWPGSPGPRSRPVFPISRRGEADRSNSSTAYYVIMAP
jgi:RHS repeat-associated protein